MKKIFQIEPSLDEDEKKEILEVMDSGWYTESSKTREFEKKFAEYTGSKYAIAVTSGTTALYMGLKSLGIGKGDEVIVPDLTFVASPNSIEMTGAKPIMVDVSKKDLNLDISKIENLITKKTKAIMPVDFNGRGIEIKKIREIAKKNNLFLVEDACHAIGSQYNNKHAGTMSDVAAFSFSIPKIITTGQGGMIITNKKEIYEKCVGLKDFGREFGAKKNMLKAFEHNTIGYNFKFTEFQASIGLAQLRKLSKRVKQKKSMFKKYKELLHNIKEIEFVDTDLKKETPWMIDIMVEKNRSKLIQYLENKLIQTRIYYPPIHRLRPYQNNDKKFPITSNISDKGLWVPSSSSLKDSQLKIVCSEIKKFFK